MDGIVILMDYSEYDREKATNILENIGISNIVEIPAVDRYFEVVKSTKGIILIIMDISFPTEKQGFGILSIIRNTVETSKTPIIITSKINDLEYRNTAALKYGVNDYIVKPYTASRLEKSVKSLIKIENIFSYNTDSLENITMSFKQFITRELKFSERMKLPLSLILFSPNESVRQEKDSSSSSSIHRDILSSVCEKIKAMLRISDTIVLGTDNEILIVLPGTDSAGANVFWERIKQSISELPINSNINNTDYYYSAHVSFPEDGTNFQDLMESAFKKISHKEMLQKISSIPLNKRKYADKLYNKFKGFYF